MSGTSDRARRPGVAGWIVIGVIAVLLAVGVTWGVISANSAGTSPAAGSSGSQTPVPPQETEFATPSPGGVDPVTKDGEPIEMDLDEPSEPVEGAVVEVVGLESLTAGRDIPGEQSGPALRVTVRISNDGDKPIDTAGSNVTLTYGGEERIPAVALTDEEAVVWPATVAPGADADAVFLFSVPLAPEGDVRVIVDLLAAAPELVFVGPRP